VDVNFGDDSYGSDNYLMHDLKMEMIVRQTLKNMEGVK